MSEATSSFDDLLFFTLNNNIDTLLIMGILTGVGSLLFLPLPVCPYLASPQQ